MGGRKIGFAIILQHKGAYWQQEVLYLGCINVNIVVVILQKV